MLTKFIKLILIRFLKFDKLFLVKASSIDNLIIDFSSTIENSSKELIEITLKKLVPVACSKKLIRIGGSGDGAYLVPNDLKRIDACFSPGTSTTTNFEDELALNYGIKSYMCDGSVEKSSLNLKKNYQDFKKLWLADFNSNNSITLSKWIKESYCSDSTNLILQIDIEGDEYPTLLATPYDFLQKFKIIIVEFHHLSRLKNQRFLNQKFLPVVDKLLTVFDCVHVHPNNCCGTSNIHGYAIPNVLEATFYRKECNLEKKYSTNIPHKLDILNIPNKEPIVLSEPWV